MKAGILASSFCVLELFKSFKLLKSFLARQLMFRLVSNFSGGDAMIRVSTFVGVMNRVVAEVRGRERFALFAVQPLRG